MDQYMVLIPPFKFLGHGHEISGPWLIDGLYSDIEEAKKNAKACEGIILVCKEWVDGIQDSKSEGPSGRDQEGDEQSREELRKRNPFGEDDGG